MDIDGDMHDGSSARLVGNEQHQSSGLYKSTSSFHADVGHVLWITDHVGCLYQGHERRKGGVVRGRVLTE